MTSGVYLLEPHGPGGTGLEPMELDPADFESELPEQQICYYINQPEIGLYAGVWTTTSMRERFGPYPGDEFMFILEGRVVMVDGEGGEKAIETGQAFSVRNAIPVSWKQEGFLRKFFVINDPPDLENQEIASSAGGVLVFDAADLAARLSPTTETVLPLTFEGTAPGQKAVIRFSNDTGTMQAGMWEAPDFASAMAPFPVLVIAQVVKGALTITEECGTQTFSSGATFCIRPGTTCAWSSAESVQLIFSTVRSAGSIS